MQKKGTRNAQQEHLYSLPIRISDGPGFRVVGAKINIRLKWQPRTIDIVVKYIFVLK